MKKSIFFIGLLALTTIMGSCKQQVVESSNADSTSSTEVTVDTNVVTMIDLPSMEAKNIANFKDGEGSVDMKMFQEGETKVMLCTIPAGSSVGYHEHDTSLEVILVQSGTATIDLDHKGTQTYTEGQAHICPKGHGHSISNNSSEDLVIYNVVAAQ